jgi:hypothetical protein
MASSRKRARTSFNSEDSLSIRLAEGGAALAADKPLLQVVAECARGLPGDDAAEWDLSSLLIEGQPVSRAVVVAWLHAVHMAVHDAPFAGEAQQEPPLSDSAAGLAQLLALADAVGSSRGVLRTCLPPLEQLQFRVQAGEQQQQQVVQLDVGAAYWWDTSAAPQLLKVGRDHKVASEEQVTVTSEAAKAQLTQQFVRQLEALLYLAHRLELDSLAQALHTCVRHNTAWASSLLHVDDSVINPLALSARVLEAAAGPGQHSQQAFINSIVTEPASFVPGPCMRQVFEPIGMSEEQKQPIVFTARLTEDFMGADSKG